MKKKCFEIDTISFIIIVVNVLSVLCFLLPPGRAYYLPPVIMEFTMILTMYAILGLGVSGVAGIVINVIGIVKKVSNNRSIWINIIYIILFILTIPLWKFIFDCGMSV